jgi:S1-C subfamily serine protease
MRRFQALLMAAGLAAAPAGAAAGPSTNSSSPPQTYEKLEWSMSKGRLGVMVMSLTPELRTYFGAPDNRGVIVARVEPGTPAATAGLAVGDVIVDVRGRAIDHATDVVAALAEVKKGQTVSIRIVRDKQPRSLNVTLSDDAPSTSYLQWFRELMRPFELPKPPAAKPRET